MFQLRSDIRAPSSLPVIQQNGGHDAASSVLDCWIPIYLILKILPFYVNLTKGRIVDVWKWSINWSTYSGWPSSTFVTKEDNNMTASDYRRVPMTQLSVNDDV
jgi:hypothetical protein